MEGRKGPRLIEEKKKNPPIVLILDEKTLKSLEKLVQLQSYSVNLDLDKHVEHMDDRLDYYHANQDVKCKLFALTLTESTKALFKSLPMESIDS